MQNENGQASRDVSFYYIDLCCRFIEQRFNNKKIQDWTNSDYLHLHNSLLKQTGVSISGNTLKRIFGKLKTSTRYYPQKATRDALAGFIGFGNWNEFEAAHPGGESETTGTGNDTHPVSIDQPRLERETLPSTPLHEWESPATIDKPGRKYWMAGILALIILSALLFTIDRLFFRKQNGRLAKVAYLHSQNQEGATPLSTIFSISLSDHFSGDQNRFKLVFGDNRRDKPIVPGELLTHFYEIPGRYYAILKYEDKAVDTLSVNLSSNGWTATAVMPSDTTRVYPISDIDLGLPHRLYVDTDALYRWGVDTNHTFFEHFVRMKKTEIDADNFELTVQVKSSSTRPGVRCSQAGITVFGEKTRHTFTVMRPGCEIWLKSQFSEWSREGLSSDMRSFTADLSSGGTLQLQVKDKKVSLFVNSKKQFETHYTYPVGKIYGLNITFAGIGEVISVSTKDFKSGSVDNWLEQN